MDLRISKATCGYKHSVPLGLRIASVSKQTSLAIEMWRTSRKHIAENLECAGLDGALAVSELGAVRRALP